MEAKWIVNNRSSRVIVFFCGWGFDERCVAHLDSSGSDVVVLFDYRSLRLPELKLTRYQEVTVVAWSFGVWVAHHVMVSGLLVPHAAYAIAGSLNPVSDTEGIPTAIFDATVVTLSQASMVKFLARICGGVRRQSELALLMPQRPFTEQLEELVALGNHFESGASKNISQWTAALVATNDSIFPYQNLVRFWGNRAVAVDAAHLCFGEVRSWGELLHLFAKKCTNALNPYVLGHE